MLVEFGNPNPTTTESRPCVTKMVTGTSVYNPAYPGDDRSQFDNAADLASEVMRQVFRGAASGVTHLPEQEVVFEVIANWQANSSGDPSWVWSDDEDFAVLLGAIFDCPVGRPGDVEDTHFTHFGPPGFGPPVAPPEAAPEAPAADTAVEVVDATEE